MAWVVNAAVRDDGAAIFDAIVNGRDWVGDDLAVEQAGPGHDISAGRAAWREMTGTELHPPLTVLAMGFLPSGSVVPRAVAAEAAVDLRRRRHAETTEPPWMFRREPPVWPIPHATERALIDDLDRRARDIDERTARPTAADEPDDLLADRSALLPELDAAGLLSPVPEEAKRERLAPVPRYEWISWGEFLLGSGPLPRRSAGRVPPSRRGRLGHGPVATRLRQRPVIAGAGAGVPVRVALMEDGMVVLPVARTNAEAHLFMELHPCDCGQARFERASSVVRLGDDLASRYHGRCAGCGADREFVFRLPPEIMLPVGGQVRYGGGEPSQLIDAGEWLWVADRYARAVPGDFVQATGADRTRYRTHLATAVAALDEVVKFLADGELRPADAVWTARGRAVYEAEPGRFDRARLAAVREVYRTALERLD